MAARDAALRQELAPLRQQVRDSQARAQQMEIHLADVDCDRAWLRSRRWSTKHCAMPCSACALDDER
jgi:hypothetical protein